MNLYEHEQQMDLAEHIKPEEQSHCYRCDRIAFAAIMVWFCVFGCAVTAVLAWFFATE